MSRYLIDLHSHTTASDGLLTPTQLVERAAQRGLQVLGIADHDTIDGLAEAQRAAQMLQIEIVPAIELSTRIEAEKNYMGTHLLGYFINPDDSTLLTMLEQVKQGRIDQKIRQIELLRDLGFDITVEEVFARASGVPGRPHIAAVLWERYPERFVSRQQIYDEYLATHAKAHVGRNFALTVAEAIEVVKQAGGLPVLAHPGAYGPAVDPVALVRQAKADGVAGVEVFYPYNEGHRPSGNVDWVTVIGQLADELQLLKTGGTDFHGRANESIDLGDSGLTEAQFAAFKAHIKNL